jgi:hypothetical protein
VDLTKESSPYGIKILLIEISLSISSRLLLSIEASIVRLMVLLIAEEPLTLKLPLVIEP